MSRPSRWNPFKTVRRRAIAVAIAAICALGASVAPASANNTISLRCNSVGSGDQCWMNYYTAYRLNYTSVSSQYGRDQICDKARRGLVGGPVDPQSKCVPNADFASVNYSCNCDLKGYGYWAGNGGNIYFDVFAIYP